MAFMGNADDQAPPPSSGLDAIGNLMQEAHDSQDKPSVGPLETEEGMTEARKVFDQLQDEPDTDHPAADTEGDEEPGEQENPDELDLSPEEEARYESALRALKRVKTPKAMLAGLSREEVLEWGSRLSADQDQIDSAFDELSALRSKAKPDASSNGERGTEAQAEPATLSREDVTPVLEAFGVDPQSEGAADAMVNALTNAVAKLNPQQAYTDSRLDQMNEALNGMLIEKTRADLEVRYPQIKGDRDSFDSVMTKFDDLMGSPAYAGRAHEALDEAAILIVGHPESTEKKPVAKKPKQSSQPRVTGQAPPKTEMNKDQSDRAFFDHIDSNPGDLKGARRVAGRH